MRLKLTKNYDVPIRKKIGKNLIAVAREEHPQECCGLLLGQFGRIQMTRAARNVHPTPATHFEIDPQTLIDAHRAEREGGYKVMGYYHSHPSGDRMPSNTDRANSAKDGKLWIIIGLNSFRLWQDNPEGFHALSYELVSG